MIVFMDQFAWVRLARQRNAFGDPDWQKFKELRDEGSVTFVISAAHYLETWHRRDPVSRQNLAAAMRDLSDYRCISPVQRITDLEIECFLLRNFQSRNSNDSPINPADKIFGRGVAHAFDSPTGRLRLVERLHSDESEEGPLASYEDVERAKQLIARIPNEQYEWWSLAAPEEDTSTLGLEFRSEHRTGSEFVASQEAKASWFKANPAEFRRVDHYVAAEITRGLLESVNDIAERHGIDAMEIAYWLVGQGPGNVKAWINQLPSTECQFHLEAAKMRNPEWKWEQHDYTDIASISGALPYVDVMVIEKPWAHVVRTAKLDHKYGTRVTTNIAGLRKIVG
jgi:hypothetical protein